MTSPDDAKALAQFDAAQDIAPFARHYNGHVREAALVRCVALNQPALLPIVASRLNDWVHQVRDAARAGIMAMAPACAPADLLGILPAVQHLRDARRTDHADWVAGFEAMLAARLTASDIAAGIASPEIAVSRAAFQLARNCRLVDHHDLIALAIDRRGDIVLAQAARALIEAAPLSERKTWYATLANSHFLLLRVASLRARLEEPSDAARALAFATLGDRAASMRDVAERHLRSRDVDLRNWYRGLLLDAATPARMVCIALGALRHQDDIALVATFTREPVPAVRAAALAAWLRLAPGSKDEIALQALRDTAPALRRFAMTIVRKHRAYIPFEQASAILTGPGDEKHLLGFAKMEQWRWLETLVQLASAREFDHDHDPAATRLLHESAQEWQRQAGRYYVPPPPRLMAVFASPASRRALQTLGLKEAWLHPI